MAIAAASRRFPPVQVRTKSFDVIALRASAIALLHPTERSNYQQMQ
jgi:hypothetical protein